MVVLKNCSYSFIDAFNVFCPQVMGSKTKIFLVLEFVTGGELLNKIVSWFFPFFVFAFQKVKKKHSCGSVLFIFHASFMSFETQLHPRKMQLLISWLSDFELHLLFVFWIMKINDGRVKEDEARKYFQQLINAVDYCHSRGVYHRDLKVDNVCLSGKICIRAKRFLNSNLLH